MTESVSLRNYWLAVEKYQPIIDGMEKRGYRVTSFDPGITFYDKKETTNGIYSHVHSLDVKCVEIVQSLMKEIALQDKIIKELDSRIEEFKEKEDKRERRNNWKKMRKEKKNV